ncbi:MULTISPECIES: hypothetical protein [Mycobacteroides]|uniref:hypothetical protein n=1 Tax=Mycobacteroides TaxID=670516 RepID=UPI0009260D0B|nr:MULTISPECIES: hypothetical protein [Mycobacteroides]MDO3312626.1 hypothetical protein [Mycobacteroides abscessus subsp. abscessus]MDO3344692.1 hypothetical protein [Mycobacteroides abscessus subsp. abscessus]QOF39382.1 hypothetical protein E3G66_003586 [Mycobacteroides abscessus]SHP88248.1 Uncharacterised protein [Mycobacteroides abscessus subsp. abscessus]SHQ27569.1 Uncharacterised protein [Mycobacteroides abscessus subsp. abscessus]
MTNDPAISAVRRAWGKRGAADIEPSTSEIAAAGEALEPVKAWHARWCASRQWHLLSPQAWDELVVLIYPSTELMPVNAMSNPTGTNDADADSPTFDDSDRADLLGSAQPISVLYSVEEIMQNLESEQQKPEKGWLRREFERARKRSESVPPHARPALIKRPRKK